MQLQRAIRGAAQLRGEDVIQIVLGRVVERVSFAEDVAAVKAAHDQIRLAVVLLQIEGGAFAAVQLDLLHLPGAETVGCDAQGQLHLLCLVRAHVAHREYRFAGRIGGQHLCLGRIQLIGHRDHRAADRLFVRIHDLNPELMLGNNGDAEIRTGEIFAACNRIGFCGKILQTSIQHRFRV